MDFNGPDFEDFFGAKLHIPTGQMWTGHVDYKDGEPVTTYKESGFTFIPVLITDGVSVFQKQALQFATKETAEKLVAFYSNKVVEPGWKVEAKERDTQDDVFWAVDRRTGKKVHMWQIWITTKEGKVLPPANAGIDANQLARTGPEWAVLFFKEAIKRNLE